MKPWLKLIAVTLLALGGSLWVWLVRRSMSGSLCPLSLGLLCLGLLTVSAIASIYDNFLNQRSLSLSLAIVAGAIVIMMTA